MTRPTGADESASATRPPPSASAAKSTGAAPRRATGRVRATAKSTAERTRTRTDAEVLDEARFLTADWSDDRLTAERLRSELRIGQKRARALRDQLQAERTGQDAEPTAYDGFEAGPLDGLDEAAQRQRELDRAPAGTA